MIPSTSPRFSRVLGARAGKLLLAVCGVVGLGSSLLTTGCGTDLITYAGEDRQQGIKLYNQGNYPEAAGAFTSAIKQRPQDYQSYYYLARTYQDMKNYHSAVKEYRVALGVMGKSLSGQEDTEFHDKILDGLAAAVVAGNTLELEQSAFINGTGPTTPDEHFVLAKIRRQQRDADSALDEYKKAADGDPKSFAIAKEYGLYLVDLNQRDKAARELRRAYVLNRRQQSGEVAKDDDLVNAGLRKVGIIPGPALGEEGDLASPVIPTGPFPEPHFSSHTKREDGQASSAN